MEIVNQSRKIIGIHGEPLLPGASMLLPEGYETHPIILDYLAKGILIDRKHLSSGVVKNEMSDSERAKIAEEAVAQYKKQQEKVAVTEKEARQIEKEAELKAIRTMKKPELLTKAIGMGIAVKDEDTIDDLKEKILAVLN